jgi:hypothetical protein
MNKSAKMIMTEAWMLARSGACLFGGSVGLYIRESLRIVWKESRDTPVYRLGVGTQIWMGFAPRDTVKREGQAMLPGLSAK